MSTRPLAALVEDRQEKANAAWMRAGVGIHHRLSGYLVQQADLKGAFHKVLADLCRTMGWAFGEVWMPDEEDLELRCVAWHASDPAEAADYSHALPRILLKKGNGPAGRAWQTGRVVWLRDVSDDPCFVDQDFAQRFELQAGVGVPVMEGREVVAVMVFFQKRPAEQDEQAVELLGHVAVHLGLFVRARQVTDRLREREQQLSTAQALSRVGSWSWDVLRNRMEWSEQLYRNLGLSPGTVKPSLPLFLERIRKEDRAFVEDRVRLLRDGAPPLAFHRVRSIPHDGKSLVLEIRAQVEKDAQGKVVRLHGTLQDVTPQVEAEEALQRQGLLLEERVHRRTAALRAANELLEAEILERRKAEAARERWTNLLREVLICADELISCTTQDHFYRRAVELPRERLGLERTGLQVVQGDQMHGTYGTDACGQTVDERHVHYAVPLDDEDLWAERLNSISAGGTRWYLKEVEQYPEYDGLAADETMHGGWVAITAIVREGTLLGFFSNDTALSGKAVDPMLQEVLAVYGTLLGSLIKSRSMAQQLATEGKRLQFMVENLPVGAAYIEKSRARINRRAEEILGYSREELDTFEKSFKALYGDRADEVMTHYQKERDAGFPEPVVLPVRRKDGSWRQVSFSAVTRGEVEIVVMQDVTDQLAAEEQIRQYQWQLRSLATEIGLAEERERRRIATGLHDEVVQMLALAKIRLGSFQSDLQGSEEQKESLQSIRRVIDSAIQETRALTFDLSPPVLYELGLVPALEWLADRTQRRHGLPCSLHREACRLPIPLDHAVVLFQAVRELINNVIRHACASRIDIYVAADRETVRLAVQDDGQGFDLAGLDLSAHQEDHHFGLFNIRERIRQLGGQFEAESQPGSGCRIGLAVPSLPEGQEAPEQTP